MPPNPLVYDHRGGAAWTTNCKSRLDRLCTKMGDVKEDDLAKFPIEVFESAGWQVGSVDFTGGLSPAQIANLAWESISAVANLRNHMFKWTGTRPESARPACEAAIKATVAGSLPLRVLTELANVERHGLDPTRQGSGLRPHLVNIGRAMSVSVGSTAGSSTLVVFGPNGMEVRTDGDRSASVVVTGEIRDEADNVLGYLHDFLQQGLAAWEALFKELGLG